MSETPERLSPAGLAHRIADLVLEKKGGHLLVLDISACSDIGDYMVIASGTNQRQIQAMTSEIRTELKKQGHLPLGVSGADHGWWVLMDYGDVVVHLMQQDARRFYDLEAIWADGKVVRRGPDEDELRELGVPPGED